ncbi:MAG: 30S ribosomal protein S18 [Planctomycetes bacterium]|nr:30S ribosomal protein S18 [Planctomycetota bacterium]
MRFQKPQKRRKKKQIKRIKTNKTIEVDYKDVDLLQKLCSSEMRIMGAKRTGLSAKSQRDTKRAVKYARFLALLPYVAE